MRDWKTEIRLTGMSQAKIASLIGISPRLFSEYLNGRRSMPKKHELKLDIILLKINETLRSLKSLIKTHK